MLSSQFYSLGGHRHLLLKYLHFCLERWKQRCMENVGNALQLSTLNASCISPKHWILDSRSLCFKLLIPWDVAGVRFDVIAKCMAPRQGQLYVLGGNDGFSSLRWELCWRTESIDAVALLLVMDKIHPTTCESCENMFFTDLSSNKRVFPLET